jgi:hypothetical protein
MVRTALPHPIQAAICRGIILIAADITADEAADAVRRGLRMKDAEVVFVTAKGVFASGGTEEGADEGLLQTKGECLAHNRLRG